MPSLISHFYRFILRRASIFGKAGETIVERRARLDKAARFLKTPPGVTIRPEDASGVPAEWTIPPGAPDDSALLYIHGGAWTIGSPRTHRAMVSQIALAAGVKALSIDYRLAPEHPFPAALEDCLAAYHWLLEQGIPATKIVLAGDSAGGNLTLATLLALRDFSKGKGTFPSKASDPLPAAAVCLSPATDLASTGESVRSRANVEVLLRNTRGGNAITHYTGDQDVHNPLISPLYGDLHGLPPILIHVGDHEILLNDSTRFVERARAAGVDAQVVVWPAMWHVFQMHAPRMPEARESIQQIAAFIRKMIS